MKQSVISLTLVYSLRLRRPTANAKTIRLEKGVGGRSGDYGGLAIQTKDGGYFFTGVTGSFDGDVTTNSNHTIANWVVKLELNSNIEWQRCFDSGEFVSASQTLDNGFIMVGHKDISG